MKRIKIQAGPVSVTAVLNQSNTAKKIWEALPFEATANFWGDEIYFSIPLSLPSEDGREIVDAGDLGYWPVGDAFCIFWGPTPASVGSEIRPSSPVNVFGKVEGDPQVFAQVPGGAKVRVERLEEST